MATYLRGRRGGDVGGGSEKRRESVAAGGMQRRQWQRSCAWDDAANNAAPKISILDDPYYAQTDSEDDEMAGPGLDWSVVQEIIASNDERFEAVVNSLNMRELLDLVSGLQSSMAEEQQRFDDLRVRLDLLGPGHLEGPEGETLSVALCSSQMRLARLCARNMRCFTQQAVRAKQNHRLISADADSRSSLGGGVPRAASSPTDTTIHYGSSNGTAGRTPKTSPESEYPVSVRRNSGDRLLDRDADHREREEEEEDRLALDRELEEGSEEAIKKADSPVRAVGFKERLRFFQQQEATSTNGNKSAQNNGVAASSAGARKTWSSSGEWTPRRGEATVLDEDDASVADTASTVTRDNSDAMSDFRTRTESDFDVSDFVVHRTTFAEDLDDAYDSCSAVEEESVVSASTPTSSPVRIIKIEVEDRSDAGNLRPIMISDSSMEAADDDIVHHGHHADPLVEQPSSDPDDDFVEQERELQKRQGVSLLGGEEGGVGTASEEEGGAGTETEEEESEEDFVDNSAQYMADPRRYVYYTDENELEVIMEQPEEEAEAAELLLREQEIENQHDDDDDDDSTDSDARSSTVDSVVQRIIPSSTPYNADNKITLGSLSNKTENGVSSDDDSVKSPSSLGFGKDENHDDSGVAEDHPSSSSAAEELDEQLSPCSSLDSKVNGSLIRSAESPDPLPRLEENVFTSNLEVPLAPPRPLPNYVPINGYREKPEIKTEKEEDDVEDIPPALPATAPPIVKTSVSSNKTPPPLPIKPKLNGHIVTFGVNKDNNEEETILSTRPRSTTLSWDPSDLLSELYKTPQINERSDCRNVSYPGEHSVMMEGYLEKLPTGKRKSTYWNSWKRRYFKVLDGHLHCFDSSYSEEPRVSLLLMGGTIERLDDKVIGLDDRKGHYLVLRCHSVDDTDEWFDVLQWHCQDNFDATYVHPVAYPLPSRKKVVIIDLGGCSTRAGILMDQPTLPRVYFPNVCATNKNSHKKVFGSEALVPFTRQQSIISFPIQPTAKITKYTIDVDSLPILFKKVFTELNMDPSLYTIALCVPRTLSPQTQLAITKLLLEDFGAQGVNMTHQALLTLYAYRSTSGVVVDIGDRLDIVPVSEGYIVENGITRLPYGGRRIAHHLNHTLAHKQISLVSDVESFLLRYLLEESCYVAQNYDEELERCRNDPESVEKVIEVDQFFQENPPFKSVTMENGRFHAPEGLFNPKLWGLDSPGVAKLVHKAIQECGMDVRREMARSVFLSGGVTCLPGFAQRLEKELDRLTPNSVVPKVHASPYRQHMAYLGACQMSLSNEFQEVCVMREKWMTSSNNQRASLINRWHL